MGKPKAPDPWQTAQAQAQWNSYTAQQQQLMNMVGQNTPWGSLDYTQSGTQTITGPNGIKTKVPTYTANVTLSPQQQAIFDQQQAAELSLARTANERSSWLNQYLGQGVDTSGFNPLATTPLDGYQTQLSDTFAGGGGQGYATTYAGADDFSADRQAVTDSLLARMAPGMEQDESRLRAQLMNSGIRPGTAAWDREFARLSQSTNDARLAAILAGGQEQQRMVDMARQAAQFGNESILSRMGMDINQFGAQNQAALAQAQLGNQVRDQQLQEALMLRNQPINEIAALMGTSQVQNPTSTFAQTPQTGVGGVDYTGLVNQKYQADLSNHQNMMGGLFGLGGSLIGLFSDRRMKEDIEPVGKTFGGVTIYRYRYKGSPAYHFGVMADEVPEAATVDPASGFLKVDYRKVA